MIQITERLKERFCKDCNIPIKLFVEPYFTERLQLLDRFYDTKTKWEQFVYEVKQYGGEEAYFAEYNRVKEAAIQSIQSTNAYAMFVNDSKFSEKYPLKYTKFSSKDVYKGSNVGRWFISIDMCKANFSSMYAFDTSIFDHCVTWETFIGKFTNSKHICGSKYIRQVVLGNCAPKRQVHIEKYYMETVLSAVLNCVSSEDIATFTNDEIVIDITKYSMEKRYAIEKSIRNIVDKYAIPMRVEKYMLYKVTGTDGFMRKKYIGNLTSGLDFKCLNSIELPFAIREFCGENVSLNDLVFNYEGKLAQLLSAPEVNIVSSL